MHISSYVDFDYRPQQIRPEIWERVVSLKFLLTKVPKKDRMLLVVFFEDLEISLKDPHLRIKNYSDLQREAFYVARKHDLHFWFPNLSFEVAKICRSIIGVDDEIDLAVNEKLREFFRGLTILIRSL